MLSNCNRLHKMILNRSTLRLINKQTFSNNMGEDKKKELLKEKIMKNKYLDDSKYN